MAGVDDRKRAPLAKPSNPQAAGASHKPSLFAKDADLPKLKPELVVKAADQVADGRGAYRGILYLSFARIADVPALFEASQSQDVETRWRRLWVLSPFLTKISRTQQGRAALAAQLRTDLPALNLLGKFEQKRHASVRRLFTRMHDELLSILMEALILTRADSRRAGIFASLLALVETDGAILAKELRARLPDNETPALLSQLVVKEPEQKKGLQTSSIRDKLVAMGSAFESEEGEDA
ncbi:MAG: hypothetical protein IT381_17395 [Deltaproteobacteria bacterium]|nr:hypothetical protein [Deltaproteobacteria bacterium]